MIKRKIPAFLMAAIMLCCSLTVSADDAGCDVHYGTELYRETRCTYVDQSVHLVEVYSINRCIKCGSRFIKLESSENGSHSFEKREPAVSQYHAGVNHYYTYEYVCEYCGASVTRTEVEYCGNPCGGIHLSIPGEDF